MPLRQGYGVLKGVVTDFKAEAEGPAPHFQIELQADGELFRAVIHVRAESVQSELHFFADEDFRHPITERLYGLQRGFHPLESHEESGALDYVRGNLFPWEALKALPHDIASENNDLYLSLDACVRRVSHERGAVYIFGEHWGPESEEPDTVFKFEPTRGIRRIHMNQKHPLGVVPDASEAYQDGGLLFHFAQEGRWGAIFLAIRS